MINSFLQSANLLADACLSFEERCVSGIQANKSRINYHLENSLMLVTALNPYIGYENAAKIAKKAYADNLTLKEAGIALGLVSSEDFDKWVNPQNMIGHGGDKRY